ATAGDRRVLVPLADDGAGDEALPDAGASARRQRVGLRVLAAEVAHHGGASRVGCPDREPRAILSAELARMRTEAIGEVPVAAFVEQVEVELAEQGRCSGGSSLRLRGRLGGGAAGSLG